MSRRRKGYLTQVAALSIASTCEEQWEQAVEQINRYADAPRVEALRQGTKLHKIIMQFEGYQLRKIDEID